MQTESSVGCESIHVAWEDTRSRSVSAQLAIPNGPAGMRAKKIVDEIWRQDVYRLADVDIDGKIVVDIGAHIGVFSVLAAKLGGKVYSYEPEAYNYRLAAGNIERNGCSSVKLYAAAVGDRFGVVDIVRDDSSGMGGIVDSTRTDSTQTVPCFPLAGIVAAVPDGQIALLKMDVEGYEHEIFSTATTETLSAIDRIVMEWHSNVGIGRIAETLLYTHSISMFGKPDHGGMLYAIKY